MFSHWKATNGGLEKVIITKGHATNEQMSGRRLGILVFPAPGCKLALYCYNLSWVSEASLLLLIWCRLRNLWWAWCHPYAPIPGESLSPKSARMYRGFYSWVTIFFRNWVGLTWSQAKALLRKPGALDLGEPLHKSFVPEMGKLSLQTTTCTFASGKNYNVYTQLPVLTGKTKHFSETGPGTSGKYNESQTTLPSWGPQPHILIFLFLHNWSEVGCCTFPKFFRRISMNIWSILNCPSRHHLLCLFTALSQEHDSNPFFGNNFLIPVELTMKSLRVLYVCVCMCFPPPSFPALSIRWPCHEWRGCCPKSH